MPYMTLGKWSNKFRRTEVIEANQIRGGTITSQQVLLAGGTNGVIRSENYDGSDGWAIFGDGSAYFGGDLTVGADLYSSNWDGTFDLSSGAVSATAGWLLDWGSGSAQFEGSVYLGDTLEISSSQLQFNGSASNYIGWVSSTINIASSADIGLRPVAGTSSGIFFTSLAGVSSATDVRSGIYPGIRRYISSETGGEDPSVVLNTDLRNDVWYSSVDSNAGPFGMNVIRSAALGQIDVTPQVSSDGVTPTQTVYINDDTYADATHLYGTVYAGDGMDYVYARSGSASLPSLSLVDDKDTGIYRVGADRLGFTLGGTHVAEFNAGKLRTATSATGSPELLFGSSTGSASAPVYSFQGDDNTGMFRSASDVLAWTTGGTTRMTLSNTEHTLAAGVHYLGQPSTTGSAANATWAVASGSIYRLYRSTSARKYKTRITHNVDYLADKELRPAKFYRKDDKAWSYGFIADDLAEQDALLGVFEDGEVENYHDRGVLAIMAAKINRLEKELAALSAR